MKNAFSAPKRVLIADDERQILRVMEEIINYGFPDVAVEMATDGKDCIEKWTKNGCDLLFLDIKMPFDGIQVLEFFQTQSTQPAIWVMSGGYQNTPENQLRFKKLGASGFLTKPVDLYQIFQIIETELAIEVVPPA
jgi:CheY-like chemotaxis protein